MKISRRLGYLDTPAGWMSGGAEPLAGRREAPLSGNIKDTPREWPPECPRTVIAILYSSFETSCDGSDNDCDGTTDETCSDWARLLETADDEVLEDVAHGPSGEIYALEQGETGFGGQTPEGSNDLVVVRYSTQGQRQWVRRVGSSGTEIASALAVDSKGRIYITGIPLSNKIEGSTLSGLSGRVLASYDSSGSRRWLETFTSDKLDQVNDMITHSSNALLISGYTSGDLAGKTNPGGKTGYFTIVSSFTGNVYETTFVGGSNDETIEGIQSDPSDNIYISGQADGPIGGKNGPSASRTDGFVAQYNGNLDRQWINVCDSSNDDDLFTMELADRKIYVGGNTRGTFGGETRSGSRDGFVAQFNLNGTRQWVDFIGGRRDGENIGGLAYRAS